ncbi:MAG: T9SS type A sorting domain-containing protein [Bacteroidetes bacterium]|nr:T9SS type A sorting domain-containing protein [Bacteroidota bacterium]
MRIASALRPDTCINKGKYKILNVIGQLVFKGKFIEKTNIQTTNFTPGVYLIKLENGKTCEFKKIVKE